MHVEKEIPEWKCYPFLKILPPFILGISASPTSPYLVPIAVILILSGSSLLLMHHVLDEWKKQRWHLLVASALWLILIGLGHGVRVARLCSDHMWIQSPLEVQKNHWLLEIRTMPEIANHSFRCEAYAWQKNTDGLWQAKPATLVYMDTSTPGIKLKPGDRLLTTRNPQYFQTNKNPLGFDPKSYYQRLGIGLNVQLKNGDFRVLRPCQHHPIRDKVLRLRSLIIHVIKRYIPNPSAAGLGLALLIGYRADLEKGLQEIYANTGVIHIIAISGLHIGLLFGLLYGICASIPWPSKAKSLRFLPPLAIIWIFTLLAGMGPSVVRSSLQFSISALGLAIIRRPGFALNSLASSAFVLLTVWPDWIHDLGFQLSYTAVAGIIICHKKISGLLPLTHPLGKKLWDGVSLTLAAQAFTTPIILYAFGRFPTYFMFSNLVTVPLSTMILMSEILICLCAGLPAVAQKLGVFTEASILWMNEYVRRMERLPGNAIDHIYITAEQLCIAFVALGAALAWAGFHAKVFRNIFFSATVIFCTLLIYDWSIRSKQRVISVWQVSNASLLLLIDGQTAYCITHSDTALFSEKIETNIRNAVRYYHIKDVHRIEYQNSQSLHIQWYGYRLLIASHYISNQTIEKNIPYDIIILRRNLPMDVQDLFKKLDCRHIVADGSNKLWKIRKWETQSQGLPLRFHPTPLQGAYVHSEGKR